MTHAYPIKLVVLNSGCLKIIGELLKEHWCPKPYPGQSDFIELVWSPLSDVYVCVLGSLGDSNGQPGLRTTELQMYITY